VHRADSALRAIQEIELAPLDDANAIRTIRELTPSADPFLVRQIQQLSGGNPLFIEELCHSTPWARARDGANQRDGTPAWLGTLIESRVSQLPQSELQVVRAAAIIGNVVPVWLLARLTGSGEQSAEVRALADRDLLYPGERPGTLRFKHGITRDVVYNSVGLIEREQAHRTIARSIEQQSAGAGQDESLETLAYHYGAAGDAENTARYAELAGNKAMAAPALDRARSQYAAALAALDALPPGDATYQRWMSIAQRFGLACVYDPTRDQLRIFRRAVELASARHDEVALARAEYWLAYITYALGDVSVAVEQCERALRVCRHALANARDEALARELEALGVQVLAILGQAHSAACEHEVALKELDQAVDARRRHKTGRRLAAGSAYTLACRGASLGDLGRFTEAHESFREALEAVASGDHAVKGSVLNWQAGVFLWQGRWSDALETALQACAVAERIESLYVFGMAESIAAYARWVLEPRDESIDVIIRTTSWLEARDKRLFISIAYGWLAEALVDAGRFQEARQYAARVVRRARLRDRFGEPMAYRAMARVRCGFARHHDPQRYLERAMGSAVSRGSRHEIAATLLAEGRAALETGRRTDAAALLGRARSEFESMEMWWHAARSQQLLGSAV
jgi:tetratricopeptide (TPR) repeat protein